MVDAQSIFMPSAPINFAVCQRRDQAQAALVRSPDPVFFLSNNDDVMEALQQYVLCQA